MERFTNKRAHIDVLDECTEEHLDDVNMEGDECGAEISKQVSGLTGVEHVRPALRTVPSDISSTACSEISRLLFKSYPKTQYGIVLRSFQFTGLKNTNGWSIVS